MPTQQASRSVHGGQLAARRHTVRRLAHKVFGIDHLRDGQQQVIDSVLDGKDTLAIMPTGSGKSLCYQIPARLLNGMTIVVSPLISLMKDQLGKLQELGIRAVQLNSSLSHEEEAGALRAIEQNACEIVFCTPERLAMADFIEVIRKVKIDIVVIDEAHCISQWGHDFRPAYIEMAASIEALGAPPVLALTATATDEVIEDIGKQLNRRRINVINTGIYRPNLLYGVVQVTSSAEKYEQALEMVRKTPGAGIVYAATVKAAQEMVEMLQQAGESVTLYHGKLHAAERKANQDLFMNGERRVMVATNAFGMGIDKHDTRFVIHLQIPANLGVYYQESGRAGRDGEDAACTLLFFQDDKRVQQFFLAKHYPDAHDLKAVFDAVKKAGGPVPFDSLEHLVSEHENKLKVTLKLLKDGKLLRQNRKLEYIGTDTPATADVFQGLAEVYVHKQERDREALEEMVGYAVSGFCRWKLLLEHFGDEPPGFEKCGRCDNCLHPPELALTEDMPIVDDEFERPPEAQAPPAHAFEVGARVRVPKFDAGVVVSVAGDQVAIEFPDGETRHFLAAYVTPA
ncbi:ATP-dependent DNA helicase RecQ [Massilia horti]|uniref:ATP-dependent DNA helicase RecQ n=1 Tax=Massilia horti TaxID=2562153 RepID=A0A4Y9T4D1_9BURK|nr:ATP-dependent DNA helicase RecQ [Massilia horti]